MEERRKTKAAMNTKALEAMTVTEKVDTLVQAAAKRAIQQVRIDLLGVLCVLSLCVSCVYACLCMCVLCVCVSCMCAYVCVLCVLVCVCR